VRKGAVNVALVSLEADAGREFEVELLVAQTVIHFRNLSLKREVDGVHVGSVDLAQNGEVVPISHSLTQGDNCSCHCVKVNIFDGSIRA
jgi:hypothetical protein